MSSEGLSLPIKPVLSSESTVLVANGTTSAPAVNFQDSKNSGIMYDVDNTSVALVLGGVKKLEIFDQTLEIKTKAALTGIAHPGAGSGLNGYLYSANDTSYGLYWRFGMNDSRDLTALAGLFYETKTTNDTETALATLDTNYNEAQVYKVFIEAVNTGATLAASFEIRGLYKNTDGTVTRVGALSTSTITDSAWTATLGISGTQVQVLVTGAAATTVRWKAHVIVRDTRTSVADEEPE